MTHLRRDTWPIHLFPLPKAPDALDAVHDGHHHVAEYHVEYSLLQLLEALDTVDRLLDDQSLLLQRSRHQLASRHIVFDQEDNLWRFLGFWVFLRFCIHGARRDQGRLVDVQESRL